MDGRLGNWYVCLYKHLKLPLPWESIVSKKHIAAFLTEQKRVLKSVIV
jgi:hypothetical protein